MASDSRSASNSRSEANGTETGSGTDTANATSAANESIDRRRAAVATAPFVALGVGNVILILFWGANPLWGFVVFVPMAFMTALAWFAFRAR